MQKRWRETEKGGDRSGGGTRGEKQREREYICALARIGYWKVREHLTREGRGGGSKVGLPGEKDHEMKDGRRWHKNLEKIRVVAILTSKKKNPLRSMFWHFWITKTSTTPVAVEHPIPRGTILQSKTSPKVRVKKTVYSHEKKKERLLLAVISCASSCFAWRSNPSIPD